MKINDIQPHSGIAKHADFVNSFGLSLNGDNSGNIRCVKCKSPMQMLAGMMVRSDNREACSCGANQWIEKSYIEG